MNYMQIYVYKDWQFNFLHSNIPEWAENIKTRDVAAFSLSINHFSKSQICL